MYLINRAITITWEIKKTFQTIVDTDLDVLIIDPDGNSIYTENAILLADFIAPTNTTDGSAEYTFNPTKLGLYKVFLTSGIDSSYATTKPINIYVVQQDNNVKRNSLDTVALNLGVAP